LVSLKIKFRASDLGVQRVRSNACQRRAIADYLCWLPPAFSR